LPYRLPIFYARPEKCSVPLLHFSLISLISSKSWDTALGRSLNVNSSMI